MRTRTVLTGVSLVALLFLTGETGDVQAKAPRQRDVALLSCAHSIGEPVIQVEAASSSDGAPVVPVGQDTSCAQELSLLLNQGFSVKDVKGEWCCVFYTLVRTR